MESNHKNLAPQERYRLVENLIEEIKLRKYSHRTEKKYISIVKRFLKSGKTPREFFYGKNHRVSNVRVI